MIITKFWFCVMVLLCSAPLEVLGQGVTSAEVDYHRFVCPAGQTCHVSVRIPAAERRVEAPAPMPAPPAIGDWSLGLAPVVTAVAGGPNLWGVELQFIGDLKVAGDWLLFHFQAGPGGASVGGGQRFTITELAGFQLRYADWGSVTLGGRHRVAFKAAGDEANALLGEGQLRFGWDHFTFGLSGGMGGAWYQTERKVSGIYPAGAKVPVEKVPTDGLAVSAGAMIEWRF